MRRVLLLALGILAACGPPRARALDQLTVADSTYLDPGTGLPYTGPVVRFFDEAPDRVQIEGSMTDGTWDGEMVVYHPNGRVRYMGTFEGGERCGPWVENADSTATLSAYEDLIREVESLGMYPPCSGGSR
jgi:hypothetical protein